MHESSRKDGVYDVHHVFADNLIFPRMILPLGQLAACFVVPGPGLTNALTGMGMAYSESAPMLVFGAIAENDRHVTMFGELTLRGSAGAHTWVAGAADERDSYRAAQAPRRAADRDVRSLLFERHLLPIPVPC